MQLVRCSAVHGNLVVADLRDEDPIYTCNRFLIYALNPECNISMHLMPGTEEGTTAISVGKSILDKSSKTNIGSLLLEFGGGGHEAAGGCKVKNEDAETVVGQLIGVDLMTYCRHNPIEEILGLPDVVERVNAYQYQKEFSELQLVRCSAVHGNLVVADLRDEDPIYTCNRFLIYALNPECNISMHLMPGTEEGTTAISVGKSILDKSSKTNIGSLLLEFGGGGHEAAGGCKVKNEDAETVVGQLIERIAADG